MFPASQEAEEVQGHADEQPVQEPRECARGPDGGSVVEPVREMGSPVELEGWGPVPVPRSDGEWVQEPIQEPVQEQIQEPHRGWELETPVQEPLQVEEPVRVTVPGDDDEWDRPIPEGNNGPLSAEDEFRLASAYAESYPREEAQARAAIYEEENPHFTVQRARVQVHIS